LSEEKIIPQWHKENKRKKEEDNWERDFSQIAKTVSAGKKQQRAYNIENHFHRNERKQSKRCEQNGN
jgi:hypothetical protein